MFWRQAFVVKPNNIIKLHLLVFTSESVSACLLPTRTHISPVNIVPLHTLLSYYYFYHNLPGNNRREVQEI